MEFERSATKSRAGGPETGPTETLPRAGGSKAEGSPLRALEEQTRK